MRHLTPAMERVWRKYMDSSHLNHKKIALVFRLDKEIEHILAELSPANGFLHGPQDAHAGGDATTATSSAGMSGHG